MKAREENQIRKLIDDLRRQIDSAVDALEDDETAGLMDAAVDIVGSAADLVGIVYEAT